MTGGQVQALRQIFNKLQRNQAINRAKKTNKQDRENKNDNLTLRKIAI